MKIDNIKKIIILISIAFIVSCSGHSELAIRHKSLQEYNKIIEQDLYFGMPYDSVIKLLGKPTCVRFWKNPYLKTIHYPIDDHSVVLNLEFGQDKKLNAYGFPNNWHESKDKKTIKHVVDVLHCGVIEIGNDKNGNMLCFKTGVYAPFLIGTDEVVSNWKW